ncbi:MAG: hypothetical protein ACYSXF_08665, partial [Planctomycetota bacterium]
SPSRGDMIRSAAESMDDVPYAVELAQLTESTWIRTAVMAGRPSLTSGATRPDPSRIVERLTFCNTR